VSGVVEAPRTSRPSRGDAANRISRPTPDYGQMWARVHPQGATSASGQDHRV